MFYNTLIKIYSNLDPNSYIKSIYTDVQPYLKSIMFEDGFEINITKRVFCDIENSINIHSYIEIENELGHSATDQEVAERLGITTDELNKLLQEVNMSQMISLEDYLEQNHETGFDPLSLDRDDDQPEARIEIVEMKRILADAIEKLPEKERMVVTLYYYEELTLKEISMIMKVSESRVSQLHTKAILRMRGKLDRLQSVI